ncbi:hypothetical protein DITRI_Ditri04bG0177800 [Diplodiscus trichospermus]
MQFVHLKPSSLLFLKMDTQFANPRGYNQERGTNIVRHQHGEGEDEHHHENKSVLKKVKAKAKKIKNTIIKHGHCHDYDHDDHGHEYQKGHVPDDHDLDEEDDDEEEMVEDPVNSSVPRMEAIATEQPRVNFGKTTATVEEPQAPQNTPLRSSQQSKDANPTKTFGLAQDEHHPGQSKVYLQKPKGLEEDPAALKDTPDAYGTTNYRTKLADPRGQGGEATGMTPILHSLDKRNVHDEQDTRREQNLPPGTHRSALELSFPTGSHDQFCPEPTPPLPIKTPKNSPLVSETTDTTKPQEHSNNIASDKPSNHSSYTEKISSATSTIASKAVSAKDVLASKLRYGENDQTPANKSNEGGDATKQSSAVDYGKKIASTVTEKLTPVYEKVAGAGSTIMSKLHGPGTGTASAVGTEVPEQDKGDSMKGYSAEKLKPSEEDRALSEVISNALHKRKQDLEKETRAREKETETEEVESVLGTGDETEERANSGFANNPNNI